VDFAAFSVFDFVFHVFLSFIGLFSADKHCERRQDPAQNQSVREIYCAVNFCNHATSLTNKPLALSVGVT
jgi:hypothetical protein